jgi:hypothetical protein
LSSVAGAFAVVPEPDANVLPVVGRITNSVTLFLESRPDARLRLYRNDPRRTYHGHRRSKVHRIDARRLPQIPVTYEGRTPSNPVIGTGLRVQCGICKDCCKRPGGNVPVVYIYRVLRQQGGLRVDRSNSPTKIAYVRIESHILPRRFTERFLGQLLFRKNLENVPIHTLYLVSYLRCLIRQMFGMNMLCPKIS